MTPFEDYAEQSNSAHEIYGKGSTGFDLWLVDNMPKTEREVEAMRKAWEAGGFFAIDTVERFLYEQEDKAGLEIAALKRLRDDLHETTNRYLERARRAENLLECWKLRYKHLKNNLNTFYGPAADPLAVNFDANKVAEITAEGQRQLANLRDLEFKPTDSPALYLQQFGRALRPGYKPPSRWQKFKFAAADVWEAIYPMTVKDAAFWAAGVLAGAGVTMMTYAIALRFA